MNIKLYIRICFQLFLLLLIPSCATEKSSVGDTRLNSIGTIKPEIMRGSILQIDTFNLTIVPPSSGVQFYKDGIVFLSVSKIENNMLSKHLSFGNIRAYYTMLYDATPVNSIVFSPSMPFSYPCEAITFSSDFNTMYFTRISETDGKEKIYKAVYGSNGTGQPGWSADINPVSFCKEQSVFTDPSLSADGQIMIFSSDKPGSAGGMDLFLTKKEGDKWTEPENIGNTINSKDNELFPYLDTEKNLFFSSDRQTGFGGYDIYVCKYNGKGWNKPEILASLINSPDDDIAFTINRKDGKSAFFTTRKKSGRNGTQLYRLTINKNVTDRSKDLSTILYGMATSKGGDMTAMATQPSTEIAAISAEKSEPKPEITKKDTLSKPSGNKSNTEIKKEIKETALPAAVVATTPATQTKPAEVKAEIKQEAKASVTTEVNENKDVVVYRVQLLTTSKSKPSYTINISNKSYSTYEYFYKDAYRITIGEFGSLASAVKFQNEVRQNGYPTAFVVAFKNNVRSTDPSLFK
jgi:hypothetical protein